MNPLIVAIAATLGLGVLKLTVALMTGSQAVLASAADSLADAGVSGLNLWAMRHAARPADAGHPYGHGKAEALASLAQGIVLAGIVVGVGRGAVLRLIDGAPVIDAGPALAAMAISMTGSFAIASWLDRAAVRTGSLVLRADAVHYRMDLWTGLAVVIGLGVAAVADGASRADAVASLAVCGIMVRDHFGLLRDAVGELMDSQLPEAERAAVERVLARFAARITGWNDLRTRRAGPDRFVQLRLTVPGTLTLADAHALAHEVEAAIVAEIAGVDVFVQIDVAPLPAG